MKVTLMLIAILIVFVGLVSAQDEPIAKPITRQYDDGHCYDYEVKMLYGQANIGNTLEQQQQYKLAADAYHDLDAIGQKC